MVAVAGPVSNVLMAIAWAMVVRIGVSLETEAVSLPLIYSGIAGISINLVLALINLLPIPPLDGSRILTGFLSPKWAWRYSKLERFGLIFMLALLWSGGVELYIGLSYVLCAAIVFFLGRFIKMPEMLMIPI